MTPGPLRAPENSFEYRVHMLEMVAQVEQTFELRACQRLRDIVIGLQKGQKIAFAAPNAHRVALNQGVSALARHALLRQGE